MSTEAYENSLEIGKCSARLKIVTKFKKQWKGKRVDGLLNAIMRGANRVKAAPELSSLESPQRHQLAIGNIITL